MSRDEMISKVTAVANDRLMQPKCAWHREIVAMLRLLNPDDSSTYYAQKNTVRMWFRFGVTHENCLTFEVSLANPENRQMKTCSVTRHLRGKATRSRISHVDDIAPLVVQFQNGAL